MFIVGFALQFDVILGGGLNLETGGYGYRLVDVVSFVLAGLFAFYALDPRRIIVLAIYVSASGILFFMPVLSPDPHTSILVYRYLLYSLAALYVAVLVEQGVALQWFCWGIIAGLVATVPIFAIQASAYSSSLVGVVPATYTEVFGSYGGLLRYPGLEGHPNAAGHIAALAAPAAAYLVYIGRSLLVAVLVGICLIAVFYYTRCRAGFVIGIGVLGLSIAFTEGKINIIRLAGMTLVASFLALAFSQLDFIAGRFIDDPGVTDNMSQRTQTTLAGIQLVIDHPFGMAADEFSSYIAAASGGLPTPHNGYLFFGGVFGLLPLVVVMITSAVCLYVRRSPDVFFALLALQVAMSFLFEQLPVSCSYAFALCLMGARAFLRTPLGDIMKERATGDNSTIKMAKSFSGMSQRS